MTDTPPSATSASNRSALFVVFLVVFIDLLGFGIVLPMLPLIGDKYVEPLLGATGASRGESGQVSPTAGLVLGLLVSSFSLMQFFFAPVWGKVSDRAGRRPILLLGLVGSVCFYALFGYAASFPVESSAALALTLFFVTRLGAGIAGATISTAQAVIADSTPPDKRKHGMAIIGAAFGIGFTFGPLIGYFAQSFFKDHPEAIGYTASAISLLALILAIILLPETRKFGEISPYRRHFLDFSSLRSALRQGSIGPIILIFFLATLGFSGFEVTLALLLKDVMRVRQNHEIFLYFAYVGFVLMLTQGYFYRKFAKRLSEITFMTIGISFMGAGIAALGGVTYVASLGNEVEGGLKIALFVALTSAVVGFAFLTPSVQALISRRTDADHQGEILGVNQSASAMARILGPLLFMPLYKATAGHLLPYLFGAIVLLMMLPLIPKIQKAEPEAEPAQ